MAVSYRVQAFGEVLFKSGIVPSDTDFRMFRDIGGIQGEWVRDFLYRVLQNKQVTDTRVAARHGFVIEEINSFFKARSESALFMVIRDIVRFIDVDDTDFRIFRDFGGIQGECMCDCLYRVLHKSGKLSRNVIVVVSCM